MAPEKPDLYEPLIYRAAGGDTAALEQLEEKAPEVLEHIKEIWFPLAQQVETKLIQSIFSDEYGKDLLAIESVKHQAEELRQTLCATHKTPLERLMVDRLLCCFIAVNHADLVAATRQPRDKAAQKWVDRCHRRFENAVKTLADLHKLAPNIQLNISERQQILNLFPQQTG